MSTTSILSSVTSSALSSATASASDAPESPHEKPPVLVGKYCSNRDRRRNTDFGSSYKTLGIILALCSGVFIGMSFVLKKKGLLAANLKDGKEAGEGYGYLKNWWWWAGMILSMHQRIHW